MFFLCHFRNRLARSALCWYDCWQERLGAKQSTYHIWIHQKSHHINNDPYPFSECSAADTTSKSMTFSIPLHLETSLPTRNAWGRHTFARPQQASKQTGGVTLKRALTPSNSGFQEPGALFWDNASSPNREYSRMHETLVFIWLLVLFANSHER
jgi:hypothetical protein